jgi:hypothetical protein
MMPRDAAAYLQDQIKDDFMVPASEGDVHNLAVIHALRTTADGMKRLADQQDQYRDQISEIVQGIHQIDKRLSIIEANSLTHRVDAHDLRIKVLEDDRQRRIGAVGLVEWMGKNWPAIALFVALVVYMVINNGAKL